jgi:amidophosphoribosyltransferase
MSVDEIKTYIGLNTLGYLSLESLVSATVIPREHLCLACFDGIYPVAIDSSFKKTCLEETSGL